jgi:hypothetical protein
MHAGPLFLVDVRYFVQPTIADKAAMGQRQVGFLTDNGRLHLHHLGDMVGAGLKLVGLEPLINAGQHVTIDVVTIVDAA